MYSHLGNIPHQLNIREIGEKLNWRWEQQSDGMLFREQADGCQRGEGLEGWVKKFKGLISTDW